MATEKSEYQIWLDICASTFTMTAVLAIAIKSAIEFKVAKQVNRWLMVLFFVATVSVMIYMTAAIVNDIVSLTLPEPSTSAVWLYTLVVQQPLSANFFNCLLATLIFRLWLVFKGSAWSMSKRVRNIFAVLFALLLAVGCAIGVSLCVTEYDLNTTFVRVALVLGMLLYGLAGGLAVYMFIHNLLGVAALQISAQDIPSARAPAPLNKQQRRMVAQSTKYLTLFLVAQTTTMMSWAPLFVGTDLTTDISWTLLRLDVTVNALCLFLQFRFAGQLYDKLCSKADGCTRKIIERCMEKKSGRKIKDPEKNLAELRTKPVGGTSYLRKVAVAEGDKGRGDEKRDEAQSPSGQVVYKAEAEREANDVDA